MFQLSRIYGESQFASKKFTSPKITGAKDIYIYRLIYIYISYTIPMYGLFAYISLMFMGFHVDKYIPQTPWMVWVKYLKPRGNISNTHRFNSPRPAGDVFHISIVIGSYTSCRSSWMFRGNVEVMKGRHILRICL